MFVPNLRNSLDFDGWYSAKTKFLRSHPAYIFTLRVKQENIIPSNDHSSSTLISRGYTDVTTPSTPKGSLLCCHNYCAWCSLQHSNHIIPTTVWLHLSKLYKHNDLQTESSLWYYNYKKLAYLTRKFRIKGIGSSPIVQNCPTKRVLNKI